MDPRTVKHEASVLLKNAAHNPKKPALIYAGASAIFPLLCFALSYVLGLAADNANGLSGITMRAMMLSGQTVLSLAATVVLPFFQMGFLFSALCYSKNEPVDNRSLLEGFRRWGAVLRLNILLALVIMSAVMACTYIAFFLFSLTPLSNGLFDTMQAIVENSDTAIVTEDIMVQLMPHFDWFFVFLGVVLIVVGLPLYYRYRMSEFALMNGAKGAFAAVRESVLLSRNHRMGMFKLDLSFWWFFLLQLLVTAVSYGPEILGALHVKLPMSADAALWVFYVAALGIQFLVTWRFALRYQATCALYYVRLREAAVQPATPIIET